MKPLLLYQQTGKSAKTRGTKTTTDAPQASQAKRKGPKSTKSQAKRQKTATPPPPPLGSPIHVESSPSSLEVQTQQAPSSPQPQEAPQTEEISTDVPKHTADPASSIIASVVSSIQTSIAPPQGKVLSMKSLSMDLSLHFLTIPVNFSADIVPSATPTDQLVVPSASTSQRREIALKQVSYLIVVLYFTNISSSNNISSFLFRNKILPTSCSPMPSKSLMMKARKQALLKQLVFHQQKLEQS